MKARNGTTTLLWNMDEEVFRVRYRIENQLDKVIKYDLHQTTTSQTRQVKQTNGSWHNNRVRGSKFLGHNQSRPSRPYKPKAANMSQTHFTEVRQTVAEGKEA